MIDVRSTLVALCASVVAGAACGGPSSFPDQGAVQAAQASWCQSYGKVAGLSADQVATCKGSQALASAQYLKGMAKCFPQRKEMLGAKAPDNTQILAECKDEVMAKLTIDEAAAQEAIDAHCERANRCEKVAIPECVSAVKKLETDQRALYYGIYSGAGLHKIADCLKSSACGADEDTARESCYKPIADKLLWFP